MSRDTVRIVPAFVVRNCSECPFTYWENDENLYGGNGWRCCRKMQRRVGGEYTHKGIDPECPLSLV